MPERVRFRPADVHSATRAHSVVGRRKILRRALVVLLMIALAAIAVVYRLRPRHTISPLLVPQALPENAQRAAAGYSFTRSEGGKEIFTVRAQRTTDLKNGQGTILEGVQMEVFGRGGDQHDLIKADRCNYNSQDGNFSCAGPVQMELNAPHGARALTIPAGSTASSATLHGRQPVYVQTSGLIYNQQTGLLTGSSHVDWRWGPAWGSATGLAYDARAGWFDLDHDVSANLPIQSTAGPAGVPGRSVITLAATHLRYTKDGRQIALAGPVRLGDGMRRMEAGHAVLDLDKQNRLTHALLDGGMQASDKTAGAQRSAEAAALEARFDPATGDLSELNANGNVGLQSQPRPGAGTSRLTSDRAHMSFVGAHFHPIRGEASGNVHLTSNADEIQAGPNEPRTLHGSFSRKELETSDLQFAFRPADGTLDEAHTEGPGRLRMISADPKTGNRIITASKLFMAFDAESRLRKLRGAGPTHIVFEPPASAKRGTVAMESHGDSLEANLDPVSGALESFQQAGHFQFLDGDRHATADRADYAADADFLTLTGSPLLTDPTTRIQADHVVVHLANNTAEGLGNVSSSHAGELLDEGPIASAKASDQSSAAGRDNIDVTNVLAERVTADRGQQSFHYEGHVRAWRGADVIEAPALDIYRAQRRIVANAGVVTSDLEPSPPHARSSTKNPNQGRQDHGAGIIPVSGQPSQAGSRQDVARQPVTIRADRLEYLDVDRKAAYRGHVRMESAGTSLNCDRLDAYFTQSTADAPSELEHAVADGNVVLSQAGRRGLGQHADYFGRDGKVVLTGGPPSLYDAQKGFTTGRTLTFFTQDDSLIIEGGSGFRSLSKHRLSR